MSKKTDYKQLWRREKQRTQTIQAHNNGLLDVIAKVCRGDISVEQLKVLYGYTETPQVEGAKLVTEAKDAGKNT